MNIASIYCNEIRSNFRKYYGNWEPTESIKLGDIGIIVDNMFIHKANINSFGITDYAIDEQDAGDKSFSSEGSVTVNLKASTTSEQVNTKAGVKITFAKENSLFINAVNCKTKRFANKIELGNQILDLYKKKKVWKKNWVIVTDIIISQNTTIAISQSANSSISLEAKSDLIQEVDMLDADLSLSVANNNQVGYCAESKQNIIPFIGICAIRDSWFKDAEFTSITKKQFFPSMRNGGKMRGFNQTESEEFGQLE